MRGMMPHVEPTKVNQATIAELVGVSQVTVSRALSGRGRVALKTRRRIFEAVKQLEYAPNPLAQGLRGGRTKVVGLLRSLAGPHPSEGVVRKIALHVQRQGYATQVVDHMSEAGVMVRMLDDFARHGVDAVMLDTIRSHLLHPRVVERLRRFTAVVAVSDRAVSVEELPVDVIQHERASAFVDIVDHLVRRGYRRPAIHVTNGTHNAMKTDAFFRRLRAWGLPSEPSQNLSAPRWIAHDRVGDATWQHLEHHCGEGFSFDALVCSNDESAMAAIAWLRSRGRRVPEDVAVIGFNDSAGAAYLDPPLASVTRKDNQVAILIGRLLFDRLANPSLPPRRECVPMRFIPRASAG